MCWTLRLVGFAVMTLVVANPTTPEPDLLETFTPEMQACLAQRKVLYAGACKELPNLVAGCPAGEWLVLDARDALDALEANGTSHPFQPRCMKKFCESSSKFYWPEDGTCRKSSEGRTLCKQGNMLSVNQFGFAECGCIDSPVHLSVNLSLPSGECFELYTKGPCVAGEVLQSRHLKNVGRVAECRPDPCSAFNSGVGGELFAQSALDGRCHVLGKEGGPCLPQLRFQVYKESHQPQCVANIYHLTAFHKSSALQEKIIKQRSEEGAFKILKSAKRIYRRH